MRAIEFKNVSFRYEDMPEPVLKNASFSLEYGKLALLYGDSGQGTSTVPVSYTPLNIVFKAVGRNGKHRKILYFCVKSCVSISVIVMCER